MSVASSKVQKLHPLRVSHSLLQSHTEKHILSIILFIFNIQEFILYTGVLKINIHHIPKTCALLKTISAPYSLRNVYSFEIDCINVHKYFIFHCTFISAGLWHPSAIRTAAVHCRTGRCFCADLGGIVEGDEFTTTRGILATSFTLTCKGESTG